MHLQSDAPGWREALLLLPDWSLVKSVDNPALLRDAKVLWAAAGRDPARLITLYRHFDIQQAPAGSWADALDHWRTMFNRFVDGTFLQSYAPYIDLINECNEFTASFTWSNPAAAARALQSMRAAATVWNDEYRGRVVTSPDGGRGFIPAGCKLCLLSGPVENDIPVEVFRLSLNADCPIDYHAYSKYIAGQRAADDWQTNSGRWYWHEQEYGLRPQWVFGECGPYASQYAGWRSAVVCGASLERLADAYRAWLRDVAQTDAYREGRLLGAGAWYTSFGQGSEYPLYEMDRDALVVVAGVMAAQWRPGKVSDDVAGIITDPAKLARAHVILSELKDLIDDTHSMASMTNQAVINLFSKTAGVGLPVLEFALTPAQRATLYLKDGAGMRSTLYTGPTLEAMANLTAAERAALIAALPAAV